MEFKIGDRVKLPLNETGTLVEKLDLLWGFDHVVRIRKVKRIKELDLKKSN